MRGAVSVALVYHFFDFSSASKHVATIIAMTITVVVFSTMVFGAATKPLLDVMLGKGIVHAVFCKEWFNVDSISDMSVLNAQHQHQCLSLQHCRICLCVASPEACNVLLCLAIYIMCCEQFRAAYREPNST